MKSIGNAIIGAGIWVEMWGWFLGWRGLGGGSRPSKMIGNIMNPKRYLNGIWGMEGKILIEPLEGQWIIQPFFLLVLDKGCQNLIIFLVREKF